MSPTDRRATIVAVDEDPARIAILERALTRRFGADYDILAASSAHAGLERLRELCEGELDADVALILADSSMPEMPGVDFLAAAGELHPDAKRAVLVEWGALGESRDSIIRGAALGQVDGYIAKPWRDGDENFYHAISEYLSEWDREHRPQYEAFRIVGDPWDPATNGLRDGLFRSGVPHGFYDAASSEGRELLERAGTAGPLPVVIAFNGRVLVQPGPVDLAMALGVNADPAAELFDLTIVGAGPAGLAAAVYAASEGLDVLVVEHEALGGQASTSSMIRNYLGFPRGLSGAELAARAYGQAWFFGSRFLIGRGARALRAEGELRVLELDDGSEARSRAVVLAAGVTYRRLGIQRVEDLVGRGIYYGAPVTEAAGLAGQHVVVVGGGNSSAQSSLHLSRHAAQVTLVVRDPALHEMSEYLIRELDARPNVDVRFNTVIADAIGEKRLRALLLRDTARGVDEEVPTSAAFILIGALPRTDWLPGEIERDERGYVMTGDAVTYELADEPAGPGQARGPGQAGGPGAPSVRRPAPLETSMPGVFAVGDVRFGSIKRVAGAVGEGSVAIRMVHEYLDRHPAPRSGSAPASDPVPIGP